MVYFETKDHVIDTATNGLVLQWVANFINNRRKINQVMQKFHKLTSLSKILMIYITQFYLLKG